MIPLAQFSPLLNSPFFLFLIYLTFGQIRKTSQKSKALSDDVIAFLKNLLSQKKVCWRLVEHRDPNHHRSVQFQTSAYDRFLTLHANGNYIETHCGYKEEGTWHIELRKKLIHFTCLKRHDLRTPGMKDQQTCQLKSFAPDQMVLFWQGHRGKIERTYVPWEAEPN